MYHTAMRTNKMYFRLLLMCSCAGGYTRYLLSSYVGVPQAAKTENPLAASLPSGLTLMSKMNVAVLKYLLT